MAIDFSKFVPKEITQSGGIDFGKFMPTDYEEAVEQPTQQTVQQLIQQLRPQIPQTPYGVKSPYDRQSTREFPTLPAGSFKQSKAPREDAKLIEKRKEAEKSFEKLPSITKQMYIDLGVSPEIVAKEAIEWEKKGKVYTIGRTLELGLITPGMLPGEGVLLGRVGKASKVAKTAQKVDDIPQKPPVKPQKAVIEALPPKTVKVVQKVKKPSEAITKAKIVYRGEDALTGKKGILEFGEGKYVTSSKKYASNYGDVKKSVISSGAKIINAEKPITTNVKNIILDVLDEINKKQVINKLNENPNLTFREVWKTAKGFDTKINKALKNNGYDGIEFSKGKIIKGKEVPNYNIWNEKILKPTKQPSEIFKKSSKLPEPKPSGIAKSIEAKAIEKGLVTKGYNKLAGFNSSTIKAQAKMASKYSIKDMSSFATGKKPLPAGMKSGTALSVAEDYALKTNNGRLMKELAESPLATQISESASELSLARMREADSATIKMKEIAKARQKSVAKKMKTTTPAKAKADIKKGLTNKIDKAKPTRYAWNNFISEITC